MMAHTVAVLMMGHIVAVLYYLLSSQKLPLIKLVHVFIFSQTLLVYICTWVSKFSLLVSTSVIVSTWVSKLSWIVYKCSFFYAHPYLMQYH
jgi:hypothetical protein